MPTLTELRKKRADNSFSAEGTESYGLPRDYYLSPEVFEREKQTIWQRNWLFVGLVEDLQKTGDYIARDFLDQKIYVIRSKDGELRAFYNVCQHRGHTLLEPGKGNARLIGCPFHAWVFDTMGNLRTAPQAKHVPGFDHAEFCIPEVRLDVLGPMVFINFDDEAKPLLDMGGRELLEQMREVIPNLDTLQCVRAEPYTLACNWKLVLEQLECYHCPYLHPEAMGPQSTMLQNSFEFSHSDYTQRHISRLKDEARDNPDALVKVDQSAAIEDFYIWFLWPNLMFAARPGAPNLQILETVPQGIGHSQHNLITLCVNNPPTEADLSHMNFYRDIAFKQDVSAMERQMDGIRSMGFVRGRYMIDREHSWWSEAGTHHFDNLVWQALNEDG